MKFLKGLLVFILVLLVVYLAGGLFLSKTYSIAESITINKPDSVVFKNTADFNQFAKWNPWFEKEPTAESKIEGAPGAVGSSIYWNGKKIGEGKMQITSIEPGKKINESLAFLQPYKSECTNNFLFESSGTGTKVTWSMDGVSPNILSRWMMVLFKGSVQDDFKHGLAKLKAHCESL